MLSLSVSKLRFQVEPSKSDRRFEFPAESVRRSIAREARSRGDHRPGNVSPRSPVTLGRERTEREREGRTAAKGHGRGETRSSETKSAQRLKRKVEESCLSPSPRQDHRPSYVLLPG